MLENSTSSILIPCRTENEMFIAYTSVFISQVSGNRTVNFYQTASTVIYMYMNKLRGIYMKLEFISILREIVLVNQVMIFDDCFYF
jgi:hypothetical protein